MFAGRSWERRRDFRAGAPLCEEEGQRREAGRRALKDEERAMSEIRRPEKHLPGTADHSVSNEVVVKGLCAAAWFQRLPRLWKR